MLAKLFAHFRFVLPFACLLSTPLYADSWTVRVDERNGLPSLSKGGLDALSSEFGFWGKNWAWAGLSEDFKVVAPYEYSIAGTDQPLNFALNGRIRMPSTQQLAWDFDLDAHSASSGVMGGGIIFHLDLERFGSELGTPELLPDNRGWAWGRRGGERLEMRFDPPMASVYFELGHESEIRAFFYKDRVPQGHRRYVATLTLSGDMAVGPTMAERYGLDDETKWPTALLDWKTAPVDLSFLNSPERPAGKHGFLKVANDKLVFGDGTPVRFWGTNLAANTLFGTSRENVRLQAHRLSELGFNLVRIHHHDSPWVVPNIFGDQRGLDTLDTHTLSGASLEKLDWWIKCLEDEGIYVWLDLEVGRQLKLADRIDGFSEISKGKPTADLRGYNYVNASIEQAMQQFNEAYVNHRNLFNGLPYKDDPAIVAMLLTNENDVTYHFGNSLLPDKQVPQHDAIYMAQAAAFAAKFGLSKDKTWQSWVHGPSKLFLNDLEHRFDADMIQHLRKLGVKVPIITTSSWGDDPLSSLPALTSGDMVDVHAYGGADELGKNPLILPTFVDWMAAAQVAGRPLSATEWNVSPFPAPDRHTSPLYVAGAASLQGWDALMQFAYAQSPLEGPGGPSNWEAYNDPGLMATLPAAALLYRRGDVQEAKTTYVFAPTPEQLFNQPISPTNSIALRTAVEKGRLMIAMPQTRELPWLEKSNIPAGAQIIRDPNQSQIDDMSATRAVSDTGELMHDWGQGTYTIDTPRSQAAMGWIGDQKIHLADVDIAVTTRNATVAVQSLDGKPISKAGAIMISLGTRSVPKAGNQMPFYSEPLRGQIDIRAPKGLRLFIHEKEIELPQQFPTTYVNGHYQITFDKLPSSYWLILR